MPASSPDSAPIIGASRGLGLGLGLAQEYLKRGWSLVYGGRTRFMASRIERIKGQTTARDGPNESLTNDQFYGIDELERKRAGLDSSSTSRSWHPSPNNHSGVGAGGTQLALDR